MNKKFKIATIAGVVALATGAGTVGFLYASNNQNKSQTSVNSVTEISESAIAVTANQDKINLSEVSGNLEIVNAGTYTLSGKLNGSIFVRTESNENVTLILDGVEINSSTTAAIAGLSGKSLTIQTVSGSKNIITDGGESEYDGAIYGDIPLIFEGEGELIINGEQTDGEGIATSDNNITINSGTIIITSNDDGLNAGGDNGGTITINGGTIYIDAGGDGIDSNGNAIINGGTLFVMGSDIGGDSGIDTDGGYQINGGTVVAVGSDMIESPENSSNQNTAAIQLSRTISAGTIVSVVDSNDNEIISFNSSKNFRTLVISSELLQTGQSYSIKTGGTHSGTLSNGIYIGGSASGGTTVQTFTQGSSMSFR